MSDVPTVIPGGQVLRTDLSGGRVKPTVLSGGQVLRTDLSGGVAPVYVAPAYPMAALFDYYWTAATLLTEADTDPVAAWTDVIAGKVLAQATPSKQPTYQADRYTYPALNFDGVGDVLFLDDLDVVPVGATASIDHAVVVITSSGGVNANSTIGGFANAANSRRMLATNRNTGQYRYSWATSAGGVAIANGVARTAPEMALVAMSASGGTLRQQYLTTVNAAVTGSWECTRMVVGADGTLSGSYADQHVHAIGVAKGAKALAIFTSLSDVLAAANLEWSVPES